MNEAPPLPALPPVVLIHGLGRDYRIMRRFERTLSRGGFPAINYEYPSLYGNLDSHVERFLAFLTEKNLIREKKLFFVGHSLGGIVVRSLYGRHHDKLPPGTVVALGSPLAGSKLAKLISRFFFARWYFGPTLSDLGEASWLKHPAPNLTVHSIAAILGTSGFFNPLINAPHDFLVSVEETKIAELASHMVLQGLHANLPVKRHIMEQAIKILNVAATS